MNLVWYRNGKFNRSWEWCLMLDSGVPMAYVSREARGQYCIQWWTSDVINGAQETANRAEFKGDLRKAKAYALALVRMGVPE